MARENNNLEKDVMQLISAQHEDGSHHHTYAEELDGFAYIRRGDIVGVEKLVKLFVESRKYSLLSLDQKRNCQYLFVSGVTLCTRFAIEGGVPNEFALNIADYFTLRMDKCASIDEITGVYEEMLKYYVNLVNHMKYDESETVLIKRAKEYIYAHIHENITIQDISNNVGLSRTYFATLFRKEVGKTVAEYVRQEKVSIAKNYLRYHDYKYIDIADMLAFSSQSHFINVFKAETGVTPKQYRERYGNTAFDDNVLKKNGR